MIRIINEKGSLRIQYAPEQACYVTSRIKVVEDRSRGIGILRCLSKKCEITETREFNLANRHGAINDLVCCVFQLVETLKTYKHTRSKR